MGHVLCGSGWQQSVFIDSTDEAWKMLKARFIDTMEAAVREIEVRLDLPSGFDVIRFSGEQIRTDRDEVEPQHIAPNDAVVFASNLGDPDLEELRRVLLAL